MPTLYCRVAKNANVVTLLTEDFGRITVVGGDLSEAEEKMKAYALPLWLDPNLLRILSSESEAEISWVQTFTGEPKLVEIHPIVLPDRPVFSS
jgi:hypothetical protein